MTLSTIGAILGVLLFILILAFQLPNWLTYVAVAPVVVFCGSMTTKEVYSVFSSSGLQLMYVICIFSGMMAATGLDQVIGNTVVKAANKADGKHRDLMIYTILFLFGAAFSFVLANNHVAMAMVPVIYGISKRTNLSYSKMILFVIFATTLGGACTLIGTTSNVYANTALLDSGLRGLGMLDFAWVGVPIMIVGGIYLIIFNRMCPSYDEVVPGGAKLQTEANETVDPQLKKKQKIVGIAFAVFLVALATDSTAGLDLHPYFIGYALIALLVIFKVVEPNKCFTQINAKLVLFCAGINLAIAIIKMTALGDIFGNIVIGLIGGSTNLYLITGVLWLGTVIMTQFMNNMACAGVLAPVAINLAEQMGADPRAMVMAIAMAATSSYLTPMASGTNQLLMPFTNLRFQDFAKYGWPLLLINFAFCNTILPLVFPFF